QGPITGLPIRAAHLYPGPAIPAAAAQTCHAAHPPPPGRDLADPARSDRSARREAASRHGAGLLRAHWGVSPAALQPKRPLPRRLPHALANCPVGWFGQGWSIRGPRTRVTIDHRPVVRLSKPSVPKVRQCPTKHPICTKRLSSSSVIATSSPQMWTGDGKVERAAYWIVGIWGRCAEAA